MAGVTGLIYSEARLVARMHKIDFAWVFPLLQALERERLKYLKEKYDKEEEERKRGRG